MSARIAVSAHVASGAVRAGARAGGADTPSHATSPMQTGAGSSAADADSASHDGGHAASGGAQPFAAALADAADGSGSSSSSGMTAAGQSAHGGPAYARSANGSSQPAPTQVLSRAQARPQGRTQTQTQAEAQTQTQTQMELQTAAQAKAVAAAAPAMPAAAGITAADDQDGGGVEDEVTSDPHGEPAGMQTHAGHRGRTGASPTLAGSDLLSSLALLQGSVPSMAAQAQLQVQTGGAGDEAAEDDADGGSDTAAAQTITSVGAALGVAIGAGAAAGVGAGAGAVGASAAADTTGAWSGVDAGVSLSASTSGAGTGPVNGETAGSGTRSVDSISGAAAPASSQLPQLLASVAMTADTTGISRSISVPVSDQAWPRALAAQVQWMAGNQVQSATLRLSPAHLGPIQVRIDLQQSQINVSFSAAHADTRSALADAIPRLREMLASGGLSLGQASVQQETSGGGHAPSQTATRGAAGADGETVEPIAVAASRALGLVDEYA